MSKPDVIQKGVSYKVNKVLNEFREELGAFCKKKDEADPTLQLVSWFNSLTLGMQEVYVNREGEAIYVNSLVRYS